MVPVVMPMFVQSHVEPNRPGPECQAAEHDTIQDACVAESMP